MDDPSTTLIGQFGHCSQELLNLLLCGAASSNVFDGSIPMGDTGLTLRGIPHQVPTLVPPPLRRHPPTTTRPPTYHHPPANLPPPTAHRPPPPTTQPPVESGLPDPPRGAALLRGGQLLQDACRSGVGGRKQQPFHGLVRGGQGVARAFARPCHMPYSSSHHHQPSTTVFPSAPPTLSTLSAQPTFPPPSFSKPL